MDQLNEPSQQLCIETLQYQLEYTFTDPLLAWESLQLAGNGNVSLAPGRFAMEGNKRLAIVGDAIIDAILARKWYSTDQGVGVWARTQSTVASNSNLARIARAQTLGLLLQRNPSNYQIELSGKQMATALEAIVGAVWLDSRDVDVVERVLVKLGVM